MHQKKLWVIVNPTVQLMLLLGASSYNKFIHKYFYELQEYLTILMCNNNIVFL